MSICKKFAPTLCALGLGLIGINPTCSALPNVPGEGIGVSFVTSATEATISPGFELSFRNRFLRADAGVTFTGDNGATQDSEKYTWSTVGDLGWRHAFGPNDRVFFSLGATGQYLEQADPTSTTWSAGAFIGLSYALSEYFMVGLTINPYRYINTKSNNITMTQQSFFSTGTASMSYFFM